MTKSKELKEFIEKKCNCCEEECNYGIVETAQFIRCVDKNITISKKK